MAPVRNSRTDQSCRLPAVERRPQDRRVDLRDLDRAVLPPRDGGEQEAEGDEDSPCRHERDHVGDAGHQVLPDRVPTPTVRAGAAAGRGAAAGAGAPLALAASTAATAWAMTAAASCDGRLDADVDGGLAGEPVLALDLEVGGVDHAVGSGDDVRVQGRGARGTLRLDDALVAGCRGGLLQRLGSHVGVRDARRA